MYDDSVSYRLSGAIGASRRFDFSGALLGSRPCSDSDGGKATGDIDGSAVIVGSRMPLSVVIAASRKFGFSGTFVSSGHFPRSDRLRETANIGESVGIVGSPMPLSAAIPGSQQFGVSGPLTGSNGPAASGGIIATAAVGESIGLRLSEFLKASPAFAGSTAPGESAKVQATSDIAFSEIHRKTALVATDPLGDSGGFDWSGAPSGSGLLPHIDLVPGEAHGGTRVVIGVGVSFAVVEMIAAVLIGIPLARRMAASSSSPSSNPMEMTQTDSVDPSGIDFEEEFEGHMYDIEFINPVSDSADAFMFGEEFSAGLEEAENEALISS
jgi:hypothetical protein